MLGNPTEKHGSQVLLVGSGKTGSELVIFSSRKMAGTIILSRLGFHETCPLLSLPAPLCGPLY